MAEKFDRSLYMSFIPEYLRGNEDFLVFLQLAATEFDITFENIEKFTDLINPDKVPMKFIEALGSFTDYKFIEQADDDFNRELLMRMRKVYEDRGTDHAIIMAATHGDNEGWVGGDIFIPGYPISKEKATLIIAQDEIFIHSRSKHSGGNVFQDGNTYMPGVIVIQLPYINDDIIQKIIEVMPAGVRFKFFLNIEIGGGTDPDYTGEYGELSVHKFFRVVPLTDEEKAAQNAAINLVLTMDPEVKRDSSDLLIRSVRPGKNSGVHNRGKRSGRMLVFEDNVYSSLIGASMLAHSFLTQGFLDKGESDTPVDPDPDIPIIDEKNNLLFKHSTDSAKFSSRTRNSGELILVEDPKESETEYILSPTGEKLDIKEKTGATHIKRDISYFNKDVDMDVIVNYRITAKRSHSSGIRSGRGKLSGIITNEINNLVRIMEITPQDLLYYTDTVKDLKPSDFRDPFYQSDPEILRQAEIFVKYLFDTVPDFDNEIITDISVAVYSDDRAVFSVNTLGKRYRSGRILIKSSYDHESSGAVSMLPICGQMSRIGSEENPDIPVEDNIKPSLRHSISTAGFSTDARISGDITQKTAFDPNGDIISFYGEHLDTKSKSGVGHIIRDISYTEDVTVDYSTEFIVVAKRDHISHGARSGRGKFSGPITGDISIFVPATEYLPSDMLYDAYSVKDKKPGEYKDPFLRPEIEVSVNH